MATKYVTDTKAGKSLSAYVILNKKGQHVATVRAHFSDSGVCLVNVHCDKDGFQRATASGYGYDKFTAALSGLTIDGHKMSDHCSRDNAPKPPKGRVTYPADFKPRKGYSLANWTTISRATGGRFYRDQWQNLALQKVGRTDFDGMTDGELATVARLGNELESAWAASDDCEKGYSSCHRLSGLDYLKALGYRVIQAI